MQATATKTKDIFDVSKALHVIKNDKDLNNIFRGDNIKATYQVLNAQINSKTIDDSILARVEEMFERIILKNQKLLKAYRNVITDTLEEPKLPKWYGKKRILEDIKNNKTTTELDRAMLSLNTLKNVYSKLNARAIKDKLSDEKILIQADCRVIIAVVRMLENKMKPILKKK